MRFPRIYGASRIWVNGIELPNPSRIGLGKKPNRQVTSSFVHYFRVQSEWIDILIQNSNKENHSGGLDWDFLVSPADLLQEMLAKLSLLDAAILGSLFFAAVYHIWLFSFRRQWLPYLILGSFFFVAMLRISVTGASHWALGFELPEVLIRRVELITYYLLVTLSLYNVQIIYPKSSFRLWNSLLYLASSLIIAITVVAPMAFANRFLFAFHMLALCSFMTMMQIVVMAMIRRYPGSLLFFCGMMAAIACSVMDILYVLQLIHLPFFIVGPGLMVFALLACVFQAFRFERIFQTLETQTDDIGRLNTKLAGQAAALEREVQHRTQELNAILQHTDAGIILFTENDRALAISPLVSTAALRMTGVSHLDLPTFVGFLKKSALNPDQQAQIIAALGATLGVEGYLFDLNADLLPAKFEFKLADKEPIVYLCSWYPQIENDLISAILLILIEVSQDAASSGSSDAQQQKRLRMSEILNLDPVKLSIAIPECRALLLRMQQSIASLEQKGHAESRTSLLRDLHTFKGLSRAFGFKHLASVTHEVEEELLQSTADSQSAIKRSLGRVVLCFADYSRDYQIIHRGHGDDPLLKNTVIADRLIKAAQNIAQKEPDFRWQKEWRSFQDRYFVSLGQFIETFRLSINEIASQLGKPAPHIRVLGDLYLVRRTLLGPLSAIFVHLLRNAIDHGIEMPDQRQKLRKSAEGMIDVETKLIAGQVQIDIFDDGRGLDLLRVYEQAERKGLIAANKRLSDDEVADLIFYSGFSTKTEASDISGRGIGMDAVRTMVHDLGGRLQIVWRGHRNAEGLRPCTWRILLPQDQFLREAS